MTTYIILFRGINVGGHNKLPMKPLVTELEKQGFNNVSYYIQSGNVVLNSLTNPTNNIVSIVENSFQLTPQLMVLTKTEFEMIVKNNPYSLHEGKFVHCYICSESPKLDNEKLEKYKSSDEEVTLIDNTLYLHAPKGIGRSKLVKNIEQCLGVAATGRNLNTINKISSMLPC